MTNPHQPDKTNMTKIKKRHGRPPTPAQANTKTTLTIKIPADMKNLMMEQADAYDMSLTEFISMLVIRDAEKV